MWRYSLQEELGVPSDSYSWRWTFFLPGLSSWQSAKLENSRSTRPVDPQRLAPCFCDLGSPLRLVRSKVIPHEVFLQTIKTLFRRVHEMKELNVVWRNHS